MIRHPTELAVLLDGIGMGPLADNWGNENTCEATEVAVSEANEAAVLKL